MPGGTPHVANHQGGTALLPRAAGEERLETLWPWLRLATTGLEGGQGQVCIVQQGQSVPLLGKELKARASSGGGRGQRPPVPRPSPASCCSSLAPATKISDVISA